MFIRVEQQTYIFLFHSFMVLTLYICVVIGYLGDKVGYKLVFKVLTLYICVVIGYLGDKVGYKLVFMVLLAACAGVGVSTVYIPKYHETARFKV